MATLTDPHIEHHPPVDPKELSEDLIKPGHPLFGVIWINRKRVTGAPCFYASRVPIKTLFDCVAAGMTLEEFLEDFEGVTREQALAVLDLAQSSLSDKLRRPSHA